jgi:hypothetical protein
MVKRLRKKTLMADLPWDIPPPLYVIDEAYQAISFILLRLQMNRLLNYPTLLRSIIIKIYSDKVETLRTLLRLNQTLFTSSFAK